MQVDNSSINVSTDDINKISPRINNETLGIIKTKCEPCLFFSAQCCLVIVIGFFCLLFLTMALSPWMIPFCDSFAQPFLFQSAILGAHVISSVVLYLYSYQALKIEDYQVVKIGDYQVTTMED